jgi:CRISPR/Cas system-associated exonuclease Cas4 (RecB family)
MIYSYTQISAFLACPRKYRYRYLDGWVERPTRASLLFGRAFEIAVSAYFRGDDAEAALYREWIAAGKSLPQFSSGQSWDKMLHEGRVLLQRFSQDNRVRIADPAQQLQIRIERQLSTEDSFVAQLDAVGELDGCACVIDWKTSGSAYVSEPQGLVSLDPQLISYSWMTGIPDVALIVFVRKRCPEIQYLKATITEQQRNEFGELVEETVRQIRESRFLPHSGIRFPQNGCTACSFLGLCLDRPRLTETALERRPGASDLDWLDELAA